MVYFAGCSFQCCAEQKVLSGCKALLKHSHKVPDEDATFVHRYSKVCTALTSIFVILLSLVRMWFHIVAKNWLQSLSEEPELEYSLFSIKKWFWDSVVSQGFMCFQGLPRRDSDNYFLDALSGCIFPAILASGNLGCVKRRTSISIQITCFNPSSLSAAA